jgi:site-specific DNA-cytosine methylase
MFRIIKTFKPRFVIGENVRGIVNIQDGVVFETVCTNLEDEGYEVQPFNIPAAAVGAPHRRERIWFIAVREESMVNSDNIRFEQHNETEKTTSWRGTSATIESTSSTNVVNSEHIGSSTSEIERSFNTSSNNDKERQNETSESKGTSGPRDGINVADTNDEGLRTRIGGSDNDHETESRSGRADGERGSSDVERNNSTSTKVEGMDVADTNESRSGERKVFRDIGNEGRRASETRGESIQPKDRQTRTDNFGSSNSNVADTESIRTREPREFDQAQRSEGSGSTQLNGSSKNDANSNEEGLQGFRQSRNQLNKRFSLRSEGSEGEHGTVGEGWWSVEPNVGRVAHGVPGRVYRLKGLGNSIVPQIVEEIGYALIKAEKGIPF